MLVFIRLFILGVILFREKNITLNFLSQILVLICVIFFISRNFLIVYIFFELSLIPILIIILGFGAQIEKINSSYYLIFYAAFCSFPFLFIYFLSGSYFVFAYFSFYFS
jgi:NADH-ubiquinone oxidoreductase chain 4